ncbi:hypothetical protein B0H14DRAFT_3021310 [Mycena olivaceomarginata]|nr:hypothetical protein B0H14DRAFT_3021310 [Mycena olivaceomarginata]
MDDSTKSMRPSGAISHTRKFADTPGRMLEVTVQALVLLNRAAENIPFLNAITDSIERLINIQKAIGDNQCAHDLLSSISELSRVIAHGLYNLGAPGRKTAGWTRYQTVLSDTCDILEDWTSQGIAKRIWNHQEFPRIADGIERRLDAFRDAFSV